MRHIMSALALFTLATVATAKDYTATITWAPNEGETVDGFRVYAFDAEGKKEKLYDGQDTIFETVISEPTVFAVVAYNEHGESDLVPRAVFVPFKLPKSVPFEVYMQPLDSTAGGN